MFGILHPNRVLVGRRIRAVKDELGLSFTDLGKRLDLIKPTINAYVQGYSLAPIEVLENLSKLSNKSVGWFYFGEIENYIYDYLLLKGHEKILSDYPNLPIQLKEEFLTGDFKSCMWENDFGYPCDEFLDDCFAPFYHEIMKEYIHSIAAEFIESQPNLQLQQKEETILLISSTIYNWFYELRDFEYGEYDKIKKMIKEYYEKNFKNEEISFNDNYLVGNLINILNDDTKTKELIGILSQHLNNHHFSNFFGGAELIEIFQSMRPELIKLYAQKTDDDFYDWFEK